MTTLTIQKAINLLHSYGLLCDQDKVRQWLKEGKIGSKINGTYIINEADIYDFQETLRWEGTAYENGIDDKTKISRLLEEIEQLKRQISDLQEEKEKLDDQLGITPF